MQTLETLYGLAEEVNNAWTDNESIDWSEAEQLIRELKAIPAPLLSDMPRINAIIAYADTNEDWDSGEVATWPEVIRDTIEGFDKTYHYREDGENWEVYSLALAGEQEWKATVETETIAALLVAALSPREADSGKHNATHPH